MSQHSKHSPSGAKTWINCPGSLKLSEGIEDTTSRYAQEGTAAHALAEKCLKENMDADAYIAEIIINDDGSKFEVTKEMAAAVQIYLDFVRREVEKYPSAILGVEKKVKVKGFKDGIEKQGIYGTADAVIIEPLGICHVIDFKYGQGVQVDAKRNYQMMIYSLAAMDIDCSEIKMSVVQPRGRDKVTPDGITTYTMTPEDLLFFKDNILIPAAIKAESGKPEFKRDPDPDGWCKWCKAKCKCPEFQNDIEEKTGVPMKGNTPITEIDLPAPEDLTTEQIRNILDASSLLSMYIDSVKNYASQKIRNGEDVPGYKLVEGKKYRQWSDPGKLKLQFGEYDIYKEPQLKTPNQVEQTLKKAKVSKEVMNKVQELIYKPEGAPTLVRESDKRQAIEFKTAAQVFTDAALL